MSLHRRRFAFGAALAILAGLGLTIYFRSITHAPVMRSLACRRVGDTLRITGITYNPNYAPKIVVVSRVAARLADGSRRKVVNSHTLGRLPSRSAARWRFTAPLPTDLASAPPIVGCSAFAWNWAPSD